MQIFDLKKGDRFRVLLNEGKKSLPLIFDHVDGMYSVCRFAEGGNKGRIIHPTATSPVEKEEV